MIKAKQPARTYAALLSLHGRFIIVAFLLFTLSALKGQSLYVKTFGKPTGIPLVFLHGGPGYNSVLFEVTAAKKLAEQGFYVVVYERRGEGRSLDSAALFTFRQTFDDLNKIMRELKLEKANLIGHSFGGIVATLFAEKYPEKVSSVILVSAPVTLQQTFKTIIKSSKQIYKSQKNDEMLDYMEVLETTDTASIEYSSGCFYHAMQNNFYTPKELTEEAQKIYLKLGSDTLVMEYAMQMNETAPMGFWKNEKYTTIDLRSNLKKLVSKNVNIYGLFGKDDGLYSKEQVKELENLIGSDKVKYYDNCSHNVFIDQQDQFIKALKNWAR